MTIIRKKPWTLRGFVMTIIIFLMVIFECAAITGSIVIARTLRRERQYSFASVLEMYSVNLEEELKLIDDFMLSSIMIEGNVREILQSGTELDRYLAEIRMEKSFVEETRHMDHLSGAVWYAPGIDTRVSMIKNDGDVFGKNISFHVNRVIEWMHRKNPADWFFYDMDGKNYLVRVLENRNTYMVGWIDTEVIFQNMRQVLPQDYHHLYLCVDGEMRQNEGEGQTEQDFLREGGTKETPYQLIRPKQEYRVALCLKLPNSRIYTFLSNPYLLVSVVLLLSGILLFIIFQKLTQYFIQPMHSLKDAMIKMQEGDFDVRMDNSSAIYEFTLLNDNFDRMAEKIKKLKITVYEKQLEKQSVELQYLQHQINPHFLTNCMNTIRSLLVIGDIEKAEQFTTLLSKNIRYDLSTRVKISLGEELNHVKNYVALQQIRYEKQLSLHLSADETLLGYEVPNMIIQTFVENSVKHQMSPDELLNIYVSVEKEENRIHMEVEDSGEGFSPELLMHLRRGEAIVKNGVEHIGIENVVKRLQIMYQGEAEILFSNSKRGALVTIVLPVSMEVEEHEA